MVSDMDRKAAEDLKTQGNLHFSKSKFAAAVEKYTEAITLYPSWAVLYINRAMAHKKREDWEGVFQDSSRALALDPDSMKGHYLLGLAHLKNHNHPLSVEHLKRALDSARDAGDGIKDEIWHELARACYSEWTAGADARRAARQRLREQLAALLAANHTKSIPPPSPHSNSQPVNGSPLDTTPQPPLPSDWEELFAAAAYKDMHRDTPSLFTCPLTMELFRDPVVVPSGRTYEKAALLEHLQQCHRKQVPGFDPITRRPITETEVFPNLSMRAAIESFLEEHPWAWGEAH